MILRGISPKEVADAIRKGSKRFQDGKIIAAYRYLEVVYKKVGEDYYVITVMLRW
jgi:hypothetical protein